METKDLLFTPIYLLLAYGVAYLIRPRLTDLNTKRYFIPAFTLKVVGAIALGLIYQYYYKYGDTLRYHYFSEIIGELLINKPSVGFKLLFADHTTANPEIAFQLNDNYFYRRDAGGFLILKICGLIGVLSNHSYYSIAVFFSFFSFIGGWYLFKTFYEIYPKIHKALFLAIFCVPSVIFWGSGILKDSITMASLGVLLYTLYKMFVTRTVKISYILLALASAYFIIVLKIYIILCFIPSFLLWVLNHYVNRIKNLFIRVMIAPVFVVAIAIGGYYLISKISAYDSRYAIENLETTVHVTSNWITYSSGETGSYYTLGDDFEFSISGVLRKLPAGINVTLFRPYLWEVNNIVMLLAAIEALILFLLTLYIVARAGILPLVRLLSTQALPKFLLVFSFSFAFAVGISTYNFGTLVRYKIPCIPFYLLLLVVVHYHTSKNRTVLPNQPSNTDR